MCLTAVKKVAVILVVVVILSYMGLCDNFLNRFFFSPAPIHLSKTLVKITNQCLFFYILR